MDMITCIYAYVYILTFYFLLCAPDAPWHGGYRFRWPRPCKNRAQSVGDRDVEQEPEEDEEEGKVALSGLPPERKRAQQRQMTMYGKKTTAEQGEEVAGRSG